MYNKTTLPNGLRIITHNIKDRSSIAIGIWVGVGGRYEEDKIKGAAHFLEHIVFKGSKRYKCEEIKENIEGVGGTLNAFTSEEQTCYYAKIPSKHLNQTFDILADMAFFPKISSADVMKEKTVILEEIKMYHDLPQYFVLELLDGLIWPDHPLGKNLAGTEGSVSSLTPKDLKTFHQRHYSPNNIVVAACGNLSHQRVVGLVKAKLSKLKEEGDTSYVSAVNVQNKPRAQFFKKDIEQMHLALGVQGYDELDVRKYAASLLSVILGGNMSSRLFSEVREKRGLAYSISSNFKTLHDTGLFLIRAGVDNQKIVGAVNIILKELNKLKRFEVSQSEFKRGKDYVLGQLELGLEDTMEHMLWIGESLVARNKTLSTKQIFKIFEQIKRSDIKRIAQELFVKDKLNLAIVGPLQKEQEQKISTLLGINRH